MLSAVEALRQKQSMNMYKFKNSLSFLIAVLVVFFHLLQVENSKIFYIEGYMVTSDDNFNAVSSFVKQLALKLR